MSAVGMHEKWARDLPLGHNGRVNQNLWGALAKVIGDKSLSDGHAMVRESLPGLASPGANGVTANDRLLEKGPAESDANFAARLIAARDQWAVAGTPVGLLMQMWWSGFEDAIIVQQNGRAHYLTSAPQLAELSVFVANWKAGTPTPFPSWYVNDGLPNNNPAIPASTDGKPAIAPLTVPWWTFDGGMDGAGNQYCSRFGILFEAAGAGAGDLTVAENLARLRRVIKAWRPASKKPVGIWVLTSGVMWGQLGLLWGGFNWGGTVDFYSAE